MKYINKDMKIKDILSKYPATLDIFENRGIKGLESEKTLKMLGSLSLEKLLKTKKINIEDFINLLESNIASENETVDVTLKKSENIEGATTLTGLLPCPVRVPLLEGLNKFLDNNPDIKVNHELKAASHGLDWLKEDVIKANHPEKLSDMFISAGFDLFFEEDLMGKFKKREIFKDYSGLEHYNKDFENDKISLKDPKGDYSMLAVVPAVFLVNKDELGDREFPKTWKDLLKPEFENSVSLPISDFDLFNAILISLYKEYGEDAIKKLGKSLLSSLHPSQMVKSDKLKTNKPTVTIMPYFFTKMAGQGGPLVAQWPEDGACISPIFMLTKREKEDELKDLSQFLAGEEVGKILSHQGLFPSVNPKVENNLNANKFMWVGWDYIYNNNIGAILKKCEDLFFGRD